MSILINSDTKVLVQGITGRSGSLQTKILLDYGTKVVAGVTPGKGGLSVEGVPVYDFVSEALKENEVDAAISFVPPRFVKDSSFEVIENGIELLVITTEEIPEYDVLQIIAFARLKGTTIIGPGTPGLIAPGKCKLRGQGLEITFDVYPYVASSTTLTILIPDRLLSGGPSKLYNLLCISESRRVIEKGIYDIQASMYPVGLDESWDKIMIVSCDKNVGDISLVGKSVKTIAEHLNMKPEEAIAEILKAQGPDLKFSSVYMVRFTMQEDEVRKAITHPLSMIMTDGRAMSKEGPYKDLIVHPRYFGTFPRYLSKYVGEEKSINWEEGIRKISSLPASIFKIPRRGQIQHGFWADIIVLNPRTVKDKATFMEPLQYNEGIEFVFVNGVLVFDNRYCGNYNFYEGRAGRGLMGGV
jgi:N-acyl-D-aspartate/D-glutamate deacylase